MAGRGGTKFGITGFVPLLIALEFLFGRLSAASNQYIARSQFLEEVPQR